MDPDDAVAQIDRLIAEYDQLRAKATYDDLSDLERESNAFVVRLRAAIDRLTYGSSSYAKEAFKLAKEETHIRIRGYVGVLQALRADITDGWLDGLAELIHAETFEGFIEQAEELLAKNYKDPAAVLVGSALESHLRLLAAKNGIVVESSPGKPKKADTLNAELCGQGVYNLVQQKGITSLLGLRNSAAHGNYSDYDRNQVSGMISSVRDFIIKYPA